MRYYVSLLAFVLFAATISTAQNTLQIHKRPQVRENIPPLPTSGTAQTPTRSFYKRKSEWQHIIDSTWGPGIPTADKLTVFDAYWNKVNETWGGFPNLTVNWDSLKSVYRPLVAAGVSRGRFYGILCRLTRTLNEWHVWMKDPGIDSIMGYDPLGLEYPNFPSFLYKPGVPILEFFPPMFNTHFGAGVTTLPDSSSLVYSVMPNHPLNLQPGDIILGYEGVPWKCLIKEFYDAELPILGGGGGAWASPASFQHSSMSCAGVNWGLFDTIDVLKYNTNDTLHYPTSLLSNLTPPYFIATEQLPVAGVPFPDLPANSLVSSGVVQGTSIGYINVLDWEGVPDGNTALQFSKAVDDLMHQKNVQGLILDFRTNRGGWPEYANDGFKHLFNFDPTGNYFRAIRIQGSDHMAFSILPARKTEWFIPTPELFDHPIAVLTGPNCGSAGDYNAFRLRFHPMVRFFGKPTAGAYTGGTVDVTFSSNLYVGKVDDGSVFTYYNNEGYIIHKPFPVDEEVWLTRDGVAKGEDDVVKRALQWINTLSYAHDVTIPKIFGKPNQDTIKVTATVENPQNHALSVWAYLSDRYDVRTDSCRMFDDGLHNDGSAGDKLYGCIIPPSTKESMFGISVRTTDSTAGTFRHLPNSRRFYVNGPVNCSSFYFTSADTIPNPGDLLYIKFRLTNRGTMDTVRSVTAKASALDALSYISPTLMPFGDAAPGKENVSNVTLGFLIQSSCPPNTIVRLLLSISTEGNLFWTDTVSIRVQPTVGVASENTVPTEYSLNQNYPNPFNPTTVMSYQLPATSLVKFVVYDLLGREVAVLVNEKRQAGRYDVTWDACKMASGIYFYRLTAGDYVSTKKLVLLR